LIRPFLHALLSDLPTYRNKFRKVRDKRVKEHKEKTKVNERKRIDMQLIVPVEDPSSGRATCSNYCLRQQREAENLTATDVVGTNANNNNTILSDDLRDQFETMKSIWRQARRGNDDGDSSSNTAMIRKDWKRKERDTAVETAIKVDNEISQWRGGIADLEALLAAEEESECTVIENNEEEEIERESRR